MYTFDKNRINDILLTGMIDGIEVALAEQYINNVCDRDKIRTTAGSRALVNRFIKQYGEEELADKIKLKDILYKANEKFDEILRYS